MPVHKYSLEAKHARPDLVRRIAHELKADQNDRLPPAKDPPEIYIEELKSDRLRVIVLWDEWKDVPEIQRSGIILDGFARASRKKDRDRMTVAMGLTREEADALGYSELERKK